MCRDCNWLNIAAAITANLETRDRTRQSTFILEAARDRILTDEHVSSEMRDAIEAFAEREGWAVA